VTSVIRLHSIRPTTQEEKDSNMLYITSSMMEAVNTCPRWGMINSVHQRRFAETYRQMALESGSLMHEVLSAINLWQVAVNQKLPEHAIYHGGDLFTVSRWQYITDNARLLTDDSLDPRLTLEKLAFGVIGTSEFHDDPDDRNRTVANLEHCALVLIEYWLSNFQRYNIYITDPATPYLPIGIEFSLDVVFNVEVDGVHRAIRFIGLADVLYQNLTTMLVTLGEYKTTSSMNDAWMRAFETRHQITGYQAALNAFFDNLSGNTIMLGSALPVTKTKVNAQHFSVTRDENNYLDFINTMLFTMDVIERYHAQPYHAPMFTHSCNRYFRPCGLLDFCTAAKEDQPIIFEQMAIAPQLSPSEMKALLRRN